MKIHYSFFVTNKHKKKENFKPCLYFVNSFVRGVWKVNFLGYFIPAKQLMWLYIMQWEKQKKKKLQQTIIMLIKKHWKKKKM